MRKNRHAESTLPFDIVTYCLLALLAFAFLFPFWETLLLSFMDAAAANSLAPRLVPTLPLSLNSYGEILANSLLLTAFGNTLFRTVVATLLTILFTFTGAFCLSKRDLPFRRAITFVILFTMFFSGGLIPTYLVMGSLGLIGSRWALILPGLTSAWYLLIARNFIMGIPAPLEEAAVMDGAGLPTVICRVIFPLSLPLVAVIALWSAIGNWNAWFDALIYTRDKGQIVLQLLLRRILIDNSEEIMGGRGLMTSSSQTTPDTIKAATIVVSILPIACFYPFVQKYFVKGITLGSVKG